MAVVPTSRRPPDLRECAPSRNNLFTLPPTLKLTVVKKNCFQRRLSVSAFPQSVDGRVLLLRVQVACIFCVYWLVCECVDIVRLFLFFCGCAGDGCRCIRSRKCVVLIYFSSFLPAFPTLDNLPVFTFLPTKSIILSPSILRILFLWKQHFHAVNSPRAVACAQAAGQPTGVVGHHRQSHCGDPALRDCPTCGSGRPHFRER